MWDWAVRALGAFWFVGGLVTFRALRQSRVLDGMFAALVGGVRRRDVVRAELLTLGAVLTTLSGLLLALLDRLAPAMLLANAVVQAAWLVYAAREFPPEDDEDRIGRARVTNAFGVWLVGTGLVIAAERFDVVPEMSISVPMSVRMAASTTPGATRPAIIVTIPPRDVPKAVIFDSPRSVSPRSVSWSSCNGL